MRRIALVIAITTFAIAWAGRGGGRSVWWLTLVGLLVSEQLAGLAIKRGVLGDARPLAKSLPVFRVH